MLLCEQSKTNDEYSNNILFPLSSMKVFWPEDLLCDAHPPAPLHSRKRVSRSGVAGFVLGWEGEKHFCVCCLVPFSFSSDEIIVQKFIDHLFPPLHFSLICENRRKRFGILGTFYCSQLEDDQDSQLAHGKRAPPLSYRLPLLSIRLKKVLADQHRDWFVFSGTVDTNLPEIVRLPAYRRRECHAGEEEGTKVKMFLFDLPSEQHFYFPKRYSLLFKGVDFSHKYILPDFFPDYYCQVSKDYEASAFLIPTQSL